MPPDYVDANILLLVANYVTINIMKTLPLHFVLMAGLEAQPRSGYDLTQWLLRVGQHFWAADHSSIYPALKHLAKEQFIDHHQEPGKKSRPRKVYRLTPAGRAALAAWVDTPAKSPQVRDELMVKALCFHLLPKERVILQLESIRDFHQSRLAEYQQLLTLHLTGQVSPDRQAYEQQLGPQLTLRRGIIAAEGYIRWCDEAIELVSNRD
jgi:PadR family transcriptional regulator, regulatory protein AphA